MESGLQLAAGLKCLVRVQRVFQGIALQITQDRRSPSKEGSVFPVTLPGSPGKAGKGLVAWEEQGYQAEQGQLGSSTLARGGRLEAASRAGRLPTTASACVLEEGAVDRRRGNHSRARACPHGFPRHVLGLLPLACSICSFSH